MRQEHIQQSFRLVATLLAYPEHRLQRNYIHLASEIRHIENRTVAGYLNLFLYETSNLDILEFQDFYIEAFGFGKEPGLYMTRGLHFRQSILGEIQQIYKNAGQSEVTQPDYLPFILAFTARDSYQSGLAILKRLQFRIRAIHHELDQMNSPYGFVLRSVLKTIEYETEQADPKVVSLHTSNQKRK